MWISAQVRQLIFDLPDGQPFPTRDLLGCGPRDAVDKAIQRLIKAEVLMRVARGIFVKPLYEKGILKLPTLAQIALAKARAFGKKLLVHGTDAACAIGILESGNEEPTFIASGSSTSFLCESADFGVVRVHFRSSSPLTKKFEDTSIGLIFRGMRSLPHHLREPARLAQAVEHFDFGRTQRKEFKDAAKWMPAWLSKLIWNKPSAGRDTAAVSLPSWDFLKKHMTEAEFADFAAREIKPLVPPWIEFPPASEPKWDLLWPRVRARAPMN
jgi:hypothetical protein